MARTATAPVRFAGLEEGSPSQAYGARLESVLGVTSLGGSNPPPSALGTPADLRERPRPRAGGVALPGRRSTDWSRIGHKISGFGWRRYLSVEVGQLLDGLDGVAWRPVAEAADGLLGAANLDRAEVGRVSERTVGPDQIVVGRPIAP